MSDFAVSTMVVMIITLIITAYKLGMDSRK